MGKTIYCKCRNCRYVSADNFENTTLYTCNFAFYLIQKIKKTIEQKGLPQKIYLTDALIDLDSECKFIDMFDIYEFHEND